MKNVCDGQKNVKPMGRHRETPHFDRFFPEKSSKILCSDIKINGSKGRIRREHRFEKKLKQVQKM